MAFLTNLLKPWGRSIIKNARIGLSSSSISPLFQFQSTRSMSLTRRRLFIGGLAYAIDETGLKEAFEKIGLVVDVKVVTDRDSGRSRGCGFVTYSSPYTAEITVEDMDGKELCGRRIRVAFARYHPKYCADDWMIEFLDPNEDGIFERYFGPNSDRALYGFDLREEFREKNGMRFVK